ncbi:MAG: thiamine phosphate synthase [Nitrosospira sp.]|nr:thiamine phosphate synthase [Nitrosospira sp.]
MLPPRIEGLYAITPDVADTTDLVTMTQQVLAGGARLVQYRNKMADAALRLEQAQALVNLCQRYNALLIINDHPDLAAEVGAAGVHVGQEDTSVTAARRRLGPGKIIGASCYNRLESAVEAERQGADYVAFGAFFVSATKPGAVTASIDLLLQAKQKLHVPVVAIGGITPHHAVGLIRQGADAIAASNALFGVPDIQSAAENFSRLFKQTRYSIHHTYELSHDFT